jgi:hypothetical protein
VTISGTVIAAEGLNEQGDIGLSATKMLDATTQTGALNWGELAESCLLPIFICYYGRALV